MSWMPVAPADGHAPGQVLGPVNLVIRPSSRDLGGFRVRRALPSVERRMVGPFVFFDHMGPAAFEAGQGIDVRPHPHIGLATLTYLVDGEMMHRDSLGTAREIVPGDVNWMTAGRGIVHSERSGEVARAVSRTMHGLQSWVALPRAHEESEPGFFHHAAASLPSVSERGVTLRLVVGALYGQRSPVRTFSETFYVDASLSAGSAIPLPPDHAERAAYLLDGEVEIAGECFTGGSLLVFRPGDSITIRARQNTRLLMLGGEPMDGPRHLWWNFVHSSPDRIEAAKADWRAGKFDPVPGDDAEFIPLPTT